MRILVVAGIFPPEIGGPATYVPQVAGALARRGHQLTVLTPGDDGVDQNGHYPFSVVRVPRQRRRIPRSRRIVAAIARLGRAADVLFVNGLAMESALANLILRKPLVQKVVGDLAWEQAANRGWALDGFETFQKTRYGLKVEGLKALRAWWTRQADQIIVPSRYLARSVATWGVPKERLSVIYNAVDVPPAVRPIHAPLRASLRVVVVGRLVPWKHTDNVIRVVAGLDGLGLVIIGDGPERQRLEALVQALGMSDRTYFAGRRTRSETFGLMMDCDIFVLNSSYEGFPHVVLEAMSLGLPVVATAIGGTPEVTEDGEIARLIPAGDDRALQAAVSRLVSSAAERECLGRRGKRLIERFTESRMVEQTETVLRTAAGARRHSGC